MDSELESNVWRAVQQMCDANTFARLIEEAVRSFRRVPGFDPLVRLHASEIGLSSIQVLRDVLRRRGIDHGSLVDAPRYLELRSRLKEHLRCQLQRHLLDTGFATDEMKDEHLCRELGL